MEQDDEMKASYEKGFEVGSRSERERIKAIEALAGAECADDIVAFAKFDPASTAESVGVAILAAQKALRVTTISALKADSAAIPMPVSLDYAAESKVDPITAASEELKKFKEAVKK